jgi:anti-anti-sigma regulatory factor
MDISITVRETADALVLTVTGRLDAEHADELARVVDDELRRGHHVWRSI